MSDCCPVAAFLKSRGFILAACLTVGLGALIAGVLAAGARDAGGSPGRAAVAAGSELGDCASGGPCQRFHASVGKEASRQAGTPFSRASSACPADGAASCQRSSTPSAAPEPSRLP